MNAPVVKPQEATALTSEQIQELKAPLDIRNVKSRQQSGRNLSYIEGWKAIEEANRIFGFDAWTRETVEIKCVADAARKIGKPPNVRDGWGVSYTAKVRVIVAGSIVREGIGAGHGIDSDLGLAHESAIKEAETDAMKRALMTFGNPFGLALYDKAQSNVERQPQKSVRKELRTPDAGSRRPDPVDIPEFPDDTPPEHRSNWNSLSLAQQAGILCGDASFWTFLTERETDGEVVDTDGRATLIVHRLCGVTTRKDLLPKTPAAKIWHGLVSDYRAWQRDPEYGLSSDVPVSTQVTTNASASSCPHVEADAPTAAINDAEILMRDWDKELAQAAERGSKALRDKWETCPPAIQHMLESAKDRRYKPRAMEVDAS